MPRAFHCKHAPIQEAASQSVLQRTRQRHQRHIAPVLEAQFPDTAATQPELLAYHYTEVGCREQAVRYGQRAGTRSAPASGATPCGRAGPPGWRRQSRPRRLLLRVAPFP